jgi:hypothetical protein
MVHRTRRLTVLAVLTALVAVAACGPSGEAPPAAGVRPDGFPTGVFVKAIVDPVLGPLRLAWVFDADGDWAEVPEAMAGQTLLSGPARGHYTVDGDLLSISVEAPSFWGDHEHRWRLEGDRLVTTFVDSEIADDAEWFAMLDRQPWTRDP